MAIDRDVSTPLRCAQHDKGLSFRAKGGIPVLAVERDVSTPLRCAQHDKGLSWLKPIFAEVFPFWVDRLN